MPTVPSPRQPAPPGSVTPLPTAEEPGWWTKPSAAQPVMSDTGPGGEGDAVAHGPAGNGNGAGGATRQRGRRLRRRTTATCRR